MFGARAIFLLLFFHQYTESEKCEVYISISQPIFITAKTSKALWDKDIHTLKMGAKYCGSYSYSWI